MFAFGGMRSVGSFMVSTDMTAVADAIRQQRPSTVIIDDLEDTVAATRDLVRLRSAIDASFTIIVTDWELNSELQQALGLSDADVVMLGRLTRDEVVSVVASVGVVGPTQLVREVVDQAEGVPGLAVTLTQAALTGDARALFDGSRLGSLMESTVNRLLGNPREGDQAILALGAVALAGDAGLTVEEVADYVRVSRAELQSLLRRLTSGGIIRAERRRVTLRPRPLRRHMIRKAFFGVGAADYDSLLLVVPDLGETAKELVLSASAGAAVPNLLDLVMKSGSMTAARYYVGSGERQARRLLEADPKFAIDVAFVALHTAPEAVIPLLLDSAVGDRRELHSAPEHPLRIIKDWANSGSPGGRDAVMGKRTLVRSALRWAAEGNDFDTACRACCEVLDVVLEVNETDPGAGMTWRMWRQMLTPVEIADLRPIWADIREAIAAAGEAPWPSLLSLCWALVHPQTSGAGSAEAKKESRLLGETIIRDLGSLAKGHPGVLDRLNTMLKHLGRDDLYPVPVDFATLFGELEDDDWRRGEEERSKLIAELADDWSTGDPGEFAARLNWLHEEADAARSGRLDRSPPLCRLMAQRVDDLASWLDALVQAGVPSPCLSPFLERAVRDQVEDWESLALPILDNPTLEPAAIDAALRAPDLTDGMWSALVPRLARYTGTVEMLCVRDQVRSATLRRLLHHEAPDVTHAAAVGMWNGETHGALPDELRQEWEDAVVDIDDDEYWLKEMLAGNPALAGRWLKARLDADDWRAFSSRENVGVAASQLDEEQRLDMLRALPAHFHNKVVITALVGDSDEVYRQVLKDGQSGNRWQDPLQRSADERWRRYAGVALEEQSPREVAGASMLRSDSWSGPESVHLQAQIDEYALWLGDPDQGVREVARLLVEHLSASRERALVEEHNEAVEGLG